MTRSILLPRELIDLVTDNFLEDKDILKTCALVGHTWASSCQQHLFRSFIVETARRGRSIQLLFKFLRSSPSVAGCIRELCLQGSVDGGAVRTVDARTVSMLLETIPHLCVLSLQYLNYGGNAASPIPSARFKLQTLRVRCRSYSRKSLRTFMEILSLFSALDALHLQEFPYFTVTEGGSEVLGQVQPPVDDPNLRRPIIRALLLECRQYPALPLLRDHLRIPPGMLTKLSAPLYSYASFPKLSEVIHEYGSTLQELELQISYAMGTSACILV